MQAYSQVDKRWGNLTIGTTKMTMKAAGCFVVALAILGGRTPDVILDILNRSNAFNKEGMLYSDIAAKVLGMSYKGKITSKPTEPCVCETDHFAYLGIKQHFFIWLNDDNYIIDPLDGLKKLNPYHVVSYRLFQPKNKPITGELDSKPQEKVADATSVTPVANKTILQQIMEKIWLFLKNLLKLSKQ